MKKLNSLPLWTGKAFRGYTGYRNAGLTAFDVIQYEIKELGNYADFKHLNNTMLKELKSYSADDLIWITKEKRTAKHYGEVCLLFIPDIARIIAKDGDNGYLILKIKVR